jgi:radical SAM protein with 4Fe4S-binding SPASM domain
VAVATHVNQLNARTLPELGRWLVEHGVQHWQIQLGTASGHMSEHRDLVIRPEDLLWLVPQIAEMRANAAPGFELQPAHNVGYYGPHESALRSDGSPLDVWVGCRAGCQVIGIESNGNVKGCLSLPSARHGQQRFVEGNLRASRLPELWTGEHAFALNRSFHAEQLTGFCAVCRYRDICRGGCAWTAYDAATDRFDNHYCFYRQAVRHRRFDLLGDDEPTADELAAIEPVAALDAG